MSVRVRAGQECEQYSREDLQRPTFVSSFHVTSTPFQSYKQLSDQLIYWLDIKQQLCTRHSVFCSGLSSAQNKGALCLCGALEETSVKGAPKLRILHRGKSYEVKEEGTVGENSRVESVRDLTFLGGLGRSLK